VRLLGKLGPEKVKLELPHHPMLRLAECFKSLALVSTVQVLVVDLTNNLRLSVDECGLILNHMEGLLLLDFDT